jgi:hypothetical protein
VHQIQIPLIPIPDDIRFGDLGELFLGTLDHLEKNGIGPFPVLIYEVCDPPDRPDELVEPSQAPERVIAISISDTSRDSLMRSLAEVEKREPPYPTPANTIRINLKDKTPLRSIFKQMAAHPLTVFSITLPEKAAGTLFFLRTAFTISELQKELPKMVVGEK